MKGSFTIKAAEDDTLLTVDECAVGQVYYAHHVDQVPGQLLVMCFIVKCRYHYEKRFANLRTGYDITHYFSDKTRLGPVNAELKIS